MSDCQAQTPPEPAFLAELLTIVSALCFRVGSLKNLASHPGATLATAGGDTLSLLKVGGSRTLGFPIKNQKLDFFRGSLG